MGGRLTHFAVGGRKLLVNRKDRVFWGCHLQEQVFKEQLPQLTMSDNSFLVLETSITCFVRYD